jgi:multicomponent Na+:H+ antiporter subunit F
VATIFLWVMIVYLLFCIILLIRGPSVWDRLLGMNLIATKVIIIIILYASFFQLAFLLDFAIISAILGFICVIFISLFLYDRVKK